EVLAERRDAVLQLGRNRGRRVRLVDVTRAADQVDHRVKGDRPAVRYGLPLQPGGAAGDLPGELVEQAGLADAGLTDQRHDLPPADLGVGQPLEQEALLGATPHEGRRRGRDLAAAAEAVDWLARARCGGERYQLEAPGEEWRRASAHEA